MPKENDKCANFAKRSIWHHDKNDYKKFFNPFFLPKVFFKEEKLTTFFKVWGWKLQSLIKVKIGDWWVNWCWCGVGKIDLVWNNQLIDLLINSVDLLSDLKKTQINMHCQFNILTQNNNINNININNK